MPTRRDIQPPAVFRELLDRAREAFVALDDEGRILEANAAAAGHLGRPRSYLIGKPFAAFVALRDRSHYRAALRDAGSAPQEVEICLQDGPGVTLTLRGVVDEGQQLVAVELRASREGEEPTPPQPPPAFDMQGFLLRVPQAVLAFDRRGRIVLANGPARALLAPTRVRVGARLPSDDALAPIRALAERLAVLRAPLPPRTVELQDGRMLRVSGTPSHADEPAILQLEDVTREYQEEQRNREFVRNAAHQLRTPLAAISSAVDVLESGAKDEPETLDRFLAHIRTHADRLTRLTRGLLVLARIEGGEDARLDLVDLRPLLETVAASAGSSVQLACPDSLAVLAETDLLHEALAALLDNAVKHAPGGDVSLSAEDVDGTVSIRVSDSGPGVLPEHRTRILEPFYRGGAQGDGFGLGLAIAVRAVRAMGGDLLVEAGGAGGQFTVRLRAATVVR
jgi:signal transduction histidine kinase